MNTDASMKVGWGALAVGSGFIIAAGFLALTQRSEGPWYFVPALLLVLGIVPAIVGIALLIRAWISNI